MLRIVLLLFHLLHISLTVRSTAQHCDDFFIPLEITSQTQQVNSTRFMGSSSVATFLAFIISSPSVYHNLTTAVNISARYCEPTVNVAGRNTSIQLLVHGITYTKSYWSALDLSTPQSGQYSWVEFANQNGYPTLSIDRAGDGASSHPDPFNVVQVPFHAAVIAHVADGLKAGRFVGRQFNKVIYVGHSLGSLIGNVLAATYPVAVDALVLTGFGISGDDASGLSVSTDMIPAGEYSPKFAGLSDGYLVTSSFLGRQAAFYGRNGTFDPQISHYDFELQQTVSIGELASFRVAVAHDYSGPVTIITGEQDAAFCFVPQTTDGSGPGGDCGVGPNSPPAKVSALFPAASNFTYSVLPGIGHCINLQYGASVVYTVAHDWMYKQGF
ncbi:hypothetical protein ZTR_09725 [Talaromyces verruculosus]|nr:hypothetical protein ZTR_09725 [Talaromyces verruculosus]